MGELEVDNQAVLDSASLLFEDLGYEQTSLQAIADKANLPLAMLEREYHSKEEIALRIYHAMAASSLAAIETLPEGTISERYFSVLEAKLAQLDTHQETVSALFSLAMRPKSEITAAQISPGLRDPMMQVMQGLIQGASDKPSKGEDELALFLYAFHFLVIVFYLYDRSAEKEASHMFTHFLRELVKMIRPMMIMPMVSKALNKVAKIMMLVFGGAKLVDKPSSVE